MVLPGIETFIWSCAISLVISGIVVILYINGIKLTEKSSWENIMKLVRECSNVYIKHSELLNKQMRVIGYNLHKADKKTTLDGLKEFINEYESLIGPWKFKIRVK